MTSAQDTSKDTLTLAWWKDTEANLPPRWGLGAHSLTDTRLWASSQPASKGHERIFLQKAALFCPGYGAGLVLIFVSPVTRHLHLRAVQRDQGRPNAHDPQETRTSNENKNPIFQAHRWP